MQCTEKSVPKILYVDDEPDIREIAVMSLRLRDDFEVEAAEDGYEAIEKAKTWQPDIILLDVMMPGLDGPMTKEQLNQDESTQDIPVVFVTARGQPNEVEKFMAMGVRGVISKPFDPMKLAEDVTAFV